MLLLGVPFVNNTRDTTITMYACDMSTNSFKLLFKIIQTPTKKFPKNIPTEFKVHPPPIIAQPAGHARKVKR